MHNIISHEGHVNQNHKRYHFTPTRMTIIKKMTITRTDKNEEKPKTSYIAGRNVKMVQQFWKTVWQFFKMLDVDTPADLAIHS